jgi:hypothetical protein
MVNQFLKLDSSKHLGAQKKNLTLPTGCLFDKGRVGCGGTSLAIESDIPYVICVPFVSLCDNKVKQYPNDRFSGEVYAFNGDNGLKRDLLIYIKSVKVPKIIVTYDSLEKLCKWINPDDYYILIDELHLLFTEYSYRNVAVQKVLENYKRFKEFTFMTATPLESDFMLDELLDLPVVEAEWDNTLKVTVESVKVTGKVKDTVVKLVELFLDNKDQNAYFFVNSVSYIKDIISHCGLDDSNCRAIYSKNNKTDVGVKRGNALDAPKKINFITSTAFEGTDFYDENGVTFVISDSSEIHTMIDISTKFTQIAGRIRNSRYSDRIFHIFKSTRYSDVSYNELREIVNKNITNTKDYLSRLSGVDYISDLKESNNLYFRNTGKEIVFDANRVKIELYNFKITRGVYSLRVNLLDEYTKNGFSANSYDFITDEVIKSSKKVSNFMETVLLVKEERESKYLLNTPIQDDAFARFPFLEKAIDLLGYEELERLEYNQTNIRRILASRLNESDFVKVQKILSEDLTNYTFYPSSVLKDRLKNVYDMVGIDKKAKGADITQYYVTLKGKPEVKKVKIDEFTYKSVEGYTIVSPKIINI